MKKIFNRVLTGMVGIMVMASSLTFAPANVSAVGPCIGSTTYTISSSAPTLLNSTFSVSGVSGVENQTGQDNTQNMAVDWDTDGDHDPLAGTSQWVPAPTDLTFNPTFDGCGFTSTWNASHTYTASGSYSVRIMVYHGSTTGHDGSASDTLTFPVNIPSTLTVIKHVVNDNSGTSVAGDFTMNVTGTDVSDDSFPGSEAGTLITLSPGSYSVDESPATGYTKTLSAGCSGTISSGQNIVCTITNDDVAPPNPTLTLNKTVTNNNGGTALVADFQAKIDGGNVAWGVPQTLSAGLHAASEVNLPGYTASVWGTDCAADGMITLALGENKVCTITNDDQQAYIIVDKTVDNTNGGDATPDAFLLKVNGNAVSDGVAFAVNPGTHTVSETNLPGYTVGIWGGDCTDNAGNGSVSVALGETKTCTITNTSNSATLKVIKTVVNDNGGTATADDWTINVDAADPSDASFAGDEDGVTITLDAGSFNVTESGGPAGYTQTSAVGCSGAIALGETKICTIVNDDVAPKLTVNKVVVNDNGGTKEISDFPLFVNETSVTSGVENNFNAGEYTISETSMYGYSSTFSGDCDPDDGSITLEVGDVATCTITNNDVAPKLTVTKTVINNNGGTKVVSDFPLFVDGNSVTSGSENTFVIGSHTVSETEDVGYAASDWGGDCAVGGTVTLAIGDSKTCTITNDDIAPKLTLVKEVVNDNGGTAQATSWILGATGAGNSPTNLSGEGGAVSDSTFKADTYTLSESTGPSGYTASDWSCVKDSVPVVGNTVTLALGQEATCTITNDDQPSTLTVTKVVTNNDGGTLQISNFILKINGNEVTSGTPNELSAGTYTVSENSEDGYIGTISGHCAADGTITLVNGQNATCTITNDDVAPGLTVIKQVINDNGGNAVVGDFTLHVTGENESVTDVSSGSTSQFTAGTYTISETGPTEGYIMSFSEDCNADGQVTISVGDETKVCIITNNDIAPTITLTKTVVNDNGGTLGANDFGLKVGGTSATSGQALAVNANSPVEITELGVSGYLFTSITGDAKCPSVLGGTVTLNEGEVLNCTITNDDVAPSLNLQKTVINNDGGDESASAWTLTATGPTTLSGEGSALSGSTFSAGTYTLSESGPEGYAAGSWVCSGGVQEGSSITLGVGQSANCSITNDDSQAVLTIVKTAMNGNGTFNFSVTGNNEFSSAKSIETASGTGTVDVALSAGTYSVSESSTLGWTFNGSSCEYDGQETGIALESGNGEQITIGNGDHVTCTFVNTIIPVVVPEPESPSGGVSSSGSRPKNLESSSGQGQVLGVATDICNTVDSYMRRGYKNNAEHVKTLQNFLNGYMKSGLVVDGNFGIKTEAAVKAFQIARKENILTPWKLTLPTGIFYKTSLVEAKRLMCPQDFGTLQTPTDLVPWNKNTTQVPPKV